MAQWLERRLVVLARPDSTPPTFSRVQGPAVSKLLDISMLRKRNKGVVNGLKIDTELNCLDDRLTLISKV